MTKFTKQEINLLNKSIMATGRTVYKFLKDLQFDIKYSYIKGDIGYYEGTYKGLIDTYKFTCESNGRLITRLEISL